MKVFCEYFIVQKLESIWNPEVWKTYKQIPSAVALICHGWYFAFLPFLKTTFFMYKAGRKWACMNKLNRCVTFYCGDRISSYVLCKYYRITNCTMPKYSCRSWRAPLVSSAAVNLTLSLCADYMLNSLSSVFSLWMSFDFWDIYLVWEKLLFSL